MAVSSASIDGNTSDPAPRTVSGGLSARVVSATCVAALVLAVIALEIGPLRRGIENAVGHHDNARFNHPLRVEAARQWADGSPPLWNPYSLGGSPLLADITAGALYPFNLPFLFTEGDRYDALHRVAWIHFVLAAVFMYVFARSLSVGRMAAFLAGLVYAGNGVFLFFASFWIQMQNAAVWLPLILAAVHRASDRERFWPWVAIGALAVALQVLSGYPQYNFYTALLAGSWALLRSLGRSGKGWRPLFAVALIYVAGMALAAVQLMPTAELAAMSRRSGQVSLEEFLMLAVPPGIVTAFAVPEGAAALSSYTPYPGAAFLGTLAVVLAVEGARSRERVRLFLTGALVVTFLLAIGPATPLGELAHRIPVFNAFRYPFKHLLEVVFCVSALAGLGAQSLLDGRPGARRCVAIGAVVAALWLGLRIAFLWTASSAAAIAFALGFVLLVRMDRRRAAVALAIVSLWVGFLSNRNVLSQFIHFTDGVHEAPRALFDLISRGERSVLGPRYVTHLSAEPLLGLQYPTEFRVPAAHGTSPFLWRPLGEALQMNDDGIFELPRIFWEGDQVWDVLSARYFGAMQTLEAIGKNSVTLGEDVVVTDRPGVLPPVRFVDYAECLSPTDIATELRRRRYKFYAVALLDCPASGRPEVAPARWRGRVAMVEGNAGRIRLRTTLGPGAPGLLVVSQADVPGWQARIDGRPVPLYRAYNVVQGIVVPAGNYEVLLEYRPASFFLGAKISLGALAVGGAWALWRMRRRRTEAALATPSRAAEQLR